VADAVEKVGGMPSARNNRIMGADFLNRYCVFGTRLEPILLGDPPQNPFSTASAQGGRADRRAECLLLADTVEKVTAEKLWNKNTQQSNRGEWIFESTLRVNA